MIIDCISDLHGHYPELEGGDLLIVAGDLTARDEYHEYMIFFSWLAQQKYRKSIVIGGNHDNLLQKPHDDEPNYPYVVMGIHFDKTDYLCDSGTEFEGLKIWGSPWTTKFKGMNPHCMAFTADRDEELEPKWTLIPEDTDILITHSPVYGILDRTTDGRCVGSKSLQMEIVNRLSQNLQLFVCGHVHEAYGVEPPGGFLKRAINASHVNEKYQPINKPIRVIL